MESAVDLQKENAIDPKYEFDAPKYYDLSKLKSSASGITGGSNASLWFENRGNFSPFPEVTSTAAPALHEKPQLKPNIVTSWGQSTTTSKRAVVEGPASGSLENKAKRPKTQPAIQESKNSRDNAPFTRSLAKSQEIHKLPLSERTTNTAKGSFNKWSIPSMSLVFTNPKSTKALTVPEDIHLSTDARCRSTANECKPSSPFKPLAVRVKEFYSKTPSRFKGRPDKLKPTAPLPITEPCEPNLITSTRLRPRRFKTKDEEELSTMESIPKFHARDLNPAVMSSSGQFGVPKVDKRQLTEPKPFTFISDDRAEHRKKRLQTSQEALPPPFKAQSLNKSILEAPAFSLGKDEHHITVPQSPNLHTKFRAHMRQSCDTSREDRGYEFRARPLPQFIKMPSSKELRLPPAPTRQLSQSAEFNLRTESRGTLYKEKMQAKLAAEEQAAREARRMKAMLLPSSTDVPLVPPKPQSKPLTMPEPFHLKSLDRHEGYSSELHAKLAEEEREALQQAEFKAQPVWKGIPFKPKENDAPLTIPVKMEFATDYRAAEREKFDQHMEEKMKQQEEERRRAEEERRLDEERQTLEYRRKCTNFKARRLPNPTKPFCPLPSEKSLTNPVSPKLGRMK